MSNCFPCYLERETDLHTRNNCCLLKLATFTKANYFFPSFLPKSSILIWKISCITMIWGQTYQNVFSGHSSFYCVGLDFLHSFSVRTCVAYLFFKALCWIYFGLVGHWGFLFVCYSHNTKFG